MRPLLLVALFVGLILPAALAASPAPARAAAAVFVYVSPTGSDTTGNGSVTEPFASISYAASTAPAGATVVVAPGTYHEMVIITQQLTLESATFQPTGVVIDATGLPNGIVILGSAASGSIVDGLTVENANNHGIYVQDANNVVIENNMVSNNELNIIPGLGEDKAIQLAGSSDSTVSGNSVTGNKYGGIGITDDGPTMSTWNVTALPNAGIPAGNTLPGDNNVISGNYVIGNHPNHCSIVVSSYNQGEGVSNNIVSYNTVVDNSAGIIVAADTPNTVAINNSVIFNTILNDGEAGVVLHSNALGDVVTGNIVEGNVISDDGSGSTPTGILVGGEGPVAVLNSTITDNTFQNEYCGIQIVNGNFTFVGGNTMAPAISLPINGTVTVISPAASTVVTTSSSNPLNLSGGISLALALITAVATLVVGMIVGIVIRPPRAEK